MGLNLRVMSITQTESTPRPALTLNLHVPSNRAMLWGGAFGLPSLGARMMLEFRWAPRLHRRNIYIHAPGVRRTLGNEIAFGIT